MLQLFPTRAQWKRWKWLTRFFVFCGNLGIFAFILSVGAYFFPFGSSNENDRPPIKPKLVTLSSNEIVLSGPGTYLVDTESKAASDELKKIYGLSEGDKVTLHAADDNRTIVVKKGNYLIMPANFSLDNEDDFIVFKSKGSNVCAEADRQNNG